MPKTRESLNEQQLADMDEKLKTRMKPIYDAIEQRFMGRMKPENGGPKKGSKTYDRAKGDFFAGAMSALNAMLSEEDLPETMINGYSMPAFWVLSIMSGRDLKCEEDA